MPAMRCAIVLSLLLAGCGDSTDIAGTYLGNTIYAASVTAPAATSLDGAEPMTVVISDRADGQILFQIMGCTLTGGQRQQEQIDDKNNEDRFVFTSDDVAPHQDCTLPIAGGTLTISIAQGDSVVDHGGTMTLELGGPIVGASAGYAAFMFAGAAE